MVRCYKIAEKQNSTGGMGSENVRRIPNLAKEVVTFVVVSMQPSA